VNFFVDKKRANVSVKYTNFCKVNRNAPLHAKLDVLDMCVSSALTYGCETWGSNVNDTELCYRSGLKTALNVRQNLNNDIVYIETGRWPLYARIKKAQLKFWMYMNDYAVEHPDSALAKVLNIGLNSNIGYLRHYQNLQTQFNDPITCQKSIEQDLLESYRQSMGAALETDEDSRLGTYYRVNPTLEKYVPKPQPTLEIERELVTRYRTGSHSLAIELGRYSNTVRENRVCCCGNSVQTVWHLFTECPLTVPLVDHHSYNNLSEVFGDDDVHRKLLKICSKLKIAI
jgi:hypothetical protein